MTAQVVAMVVVAAAALKCGVEQKVAWINKTQAACFSELAGRSVASPTLHHWAVHSSLRRSPVHPAYCWSSQVWGQETSLHLRPSSWEGWRDASRDGWWVWRDH